MNYVKILLHCLVNLLALQSTAPRFPGLLAGTPVSSVRPCRATRLPIALIYDDPHNLRRHKSYHVPWAFLEMDVAPLNKSPSFVTDVCVRVCV